MVWLGVSPNEGFGWCFHISTEGATARRLGGGKDDGAMAENNRRPGNPAIALKLISSMFFTSFQGN